jgi:hypothetical protein
MPIDAAQVSMYLINGLLLVVAYFVKNSVTDLKDELHSLKDKQSDTDRELNRLHVMLPTNYVTRGDFMILLTRLDEIQKTTNSSLMDIQSTLLDFIKDHK